MLPVICGAGREFFVSVFEHDGIKAVRIVKTAAIVIDLIFIFISCLI